MDKVFVVVYFDENGTETVAAFKSMDDAETAAIAIIDEKAPLWNIPIDENMTNRDKLGMVDNWSVLTDSRERLGVYDCPMNFLLRSQYA